jgi:aspartate-semialdehyde dehydrogenase
VGAASSADSVPASGLTVAVTGATGEIGRPFVRALELTAEVERVLAMARRRLDPGELGWNKTEYRQGDILDRAAQSTSSLGMSMSSYTLPSSS